LKSRFRSLELRMLVRVNAAEAEFGSSLLRVNVGVR